MDFIKVLLKNFGVSIYSIEVALKASTESTSTFISNLLVFLNFPLVVIYLYILNMSK